MSSYGNIPTGTRVTVNLDNGQVHGTIASDQGNEVFVNTDAGNLLRAHKRQVIVDYDEDRVLRILSAWKGLN